MEIKKSFYIIFFTFLYFYTFNLFAQKPNDAIEPFCNSNLKGVNTSNLDLENFEIKVNKNKQWNENLLKIYLNYQKKKNNSEHSNWVSNFRITDKYKKKYDATVFVKYKNFKGCNFKAKIRLTGDLWWHLNWQNSSPISSLHVQLLDGHIFNITKFKLFLKKARYGTNEVFISNFFKEIGFLSPRTFLIKTKINNIPIEYIFQEDIKKELIESSKFREGPIIEGDERFTVKLTEEETVDFKGLNYSKISNKKYLYKNKLNTLIGVEAISNLNKVYGYNHKFKFTKKINDPFEDIFYLFTDKFFKKENIEHLNIFESYSYALDSTHGLSMDDRRYYYDSYKRFYLPIYYDGKSRILNKDQYLDLSKDIKNIIISNEAIIGAKPSLELLKKLDIKNFLHNLNKSGIKMSLSELNLILKKIEKRLNIISSIEIKDNNFKLNKNYFKTIEEQKIDANFLYSNIIDQKIYLCDTYKKNCQVLDYNNDNFTNLLNESLSQNLKKSNLNLKENNPNIYISDENIFNSKKFTFLNNQWNEIKLNNTLIEYIDVEINIDNNSKTIIINQKNVDGKIIFLGGELDKWKISFEGVTENNNLNGLKNSSNLTGCLSFYEVSFNKVSISSQNSVCEDSVNIIRSSGTVEEVIINNSISDSLDVDFSEIIFEKVKILNSYNDCIDFSYGRYVLNKVDLLNCTDKGVSVGEKTSMLIKEIDINKALIGIASKDSSTTEIINADIDNTEICLSAYRKKIEFAGGKLVLHNINCESDINFFSNDSEVINKKNL
tara:strand:+ start:2015 stop:4342 length:2328 start_codon:yes stop_codon:yes gene_type:complete